MGLYEDLHEDLYVDLYEEPTVGGTRCGARDERERGRGEREGQFELLSFVFVVFA